MVKRPGQLSYRQLSCFCGRPNVCQCFGPESAYFPVQSDLTSDAATVIRNDLEPSSTIQKLEKITEVTESLISRDCVVKYDGKAFPGVILSVDEEEEVEVKTMHRIGRIRFFWPLIDDVLWYAKDNVINLLRNPPRPVSKRHLEIDPDVWTLVEKEEED